MKFTHANDDEAHLEASEHTLAERAAATSRSIWVSVGVWPIIRLLTPSLHLGCGEK